jgi:hypothetical protein
MDNVQKVNYCGNTCLPNFQNYPYGILICTIVSEERFRPTTCTCFPIWHVNIYSFRILPCNFFKTRRKYDFAALRDFSAEETNKVTPDTDPRKRNSMGQVFLMLTAHTDGVLTMMAYRRGTDTNSNTETAIYRLNWVGFTSGGKRTTSDIKFTAVFQGRGRS